MPVAATPTSRPKDVQRTVQPTERAGPAVAVAGVPTFLQVASTEEQVQARPVVNEPRDRFEEEADAVSTLATGAAPGPSRSAASHATPYDTRRSAIGAGVNALAPPDGGMPMNETVRQRVEPVLGRDLSAVRVHDSPAAQTTAARLNARAFTRGDHIWLGRGEQAHDVSLMAHEATHVVQQQKTSDTPVVQRNVLPPPPLPTPEAEGLPGYDDSAPTGDAAMSEYLGTQSLRMREIDEQLTQAQPQSAQDRAELEETLMRAVRLNALGIMSSHRASIEEARDRLESRTTHPGFSEQPQPRASVLTELREAAGIVHNLQEIEERLQDYRRRLGYARSKALFQRGSVGDTLEMIADNGMEFMIEDVRDGLRDSWQVARGDRSLEWLWCYGAANAIIELREEQIAGTRLAISEVYTRFPLFAELDAADVVSGELSSDQALMDASREAYRAVLDKVDNAIRDIATGDIHPFDLPVAVEATKSDKSPAVQQALTEAMNRRQMRQFWLTMGLTALEILLCFIPVVGPALSLALGALVLGMTVEDMLDRLTVARASTDPYENPVGVQGPSAFEWTMVGVAGILLAFGGAMMVRSAMPTFRAFSTLGRLAPGLNAGSRMRLARIMARQPELTILPRTTAGLDAELRAAGTELSAAELRALRAASYEQAGLPQPRSSADSLDDFLDQVWADRQALAPGGEPAIYGRYSGAGQQQNPLTISPDEYLARVEGLRNGRPANAVSNVQGNRLRGFHRFERPGFDPTRVRERIYLNVNADQAPDVMEFVVRNIVDDPSVPGVQMAKLSGPGAVSGRADAIVIYLDDAASAERVLGRLRGYQGGNAGSFRIGGPALTEEVMPGVAVAQEPTPMHGGASFGQVRSGAISQALEETMVAGGTRENFVTRVRELLRASGVNPDAPHLNLPPPVQSGGVVPPAGPIVGPPVNPLLQGGRDDRGEE